VQLFPDSAAAGALNDLTMLLFVIDAACVVISDAATLRRARRPPPDRAAGRSPGIGEPATRSSAPESARARAARWRRSRWRPRRPAPSILAIGERCEGLIFLTPAGSGWTGTAPGGSSAGSPAAPGSPRMSGTHTLRHASRAARPCTGAPRATGPTHRRSASSWPSGCLLRAQVHRSLN